MTTLSVSEALGGLTPTEAGSKILVQLISAGDGSTARYTSEALKATAEAGVGGAGLHMYWDHPTVSEASERPERSLRDLAAVLTSDARYDSLSDSLVAEAFVYAPYREAVQEMMADIGTSVRGEILVSEYTEEGLPIAERFASLDSVDFVTKAGRGGRVLAVMESNRNVTARKVYTEEATYQNLRDRLTDLIRGAYGADQRYAWVRDFNESTVWFDVDSESESKIYQQEYHQGSEDKLSLVGQPIEVRPVTSYEPVTESQIPSRPAGVESLKGDNMDTVQVDQQRLTALEADSKRVEALEAQFEQLKLENASLKTQAIEAQARQIVVESGHPFDKYQTQGLLASLPVKDGEFDAEAFKAEVSEAAATLAAESGAGQPHGVGVQESAGDDLSDEELDAELAKIGG